jgi:uncharacterized RDD family membrane protein YckC
MKTLYRAAFLALVAALAAGSLPVEAQPRQRVPPQVAPAAGQPGTAAAESITPVQPKPEQPDPDVERVFRYRRPVFRLGQDYALRADESVTHLVVVMGDVTIAGRVDNDLSVTLGSVRLASTARIGGSLVVVGGNVIAEDGARVRQEVVVVGGTLTSDREVISEWGEQVVVGTPAVGRTIQGVVPWLTRGPLLGRLVVPDLWWMWWAVALFFVVYLAINTLLDRPVRASARVLSARPLSAFLLGLLVLLLTVPVLAILAASIIGIAVVPFVLCAIVAGAVIGKVAVIRSIGLAAIRPGGEEGRAMAFGAFILGFAVLTIAYIVPILGVVTWALTSVFGLGAAAVAFRTSLRRERPAVPVTPPPPPPEVMAAAAAPVVEPSVITAEPAPRVVNAPAFEAPVADAQPFTPPPLRTGEGLAQYPRAAFLDRVAAFALDAILVAIVNQLLFDMSRYEGMFPFLLLVYHIAFWAWRGTTLGGIIISLRVVRTHGANPRPVDALVRGLSSIFSIAALGIGCLWMLQDPEKQMWHDKIAGTIVVKVPRDLVLP